MLSRVGHPDPDSASLLPLAKRTATAVGVALLIVILAYVLLWLANVPLMMLFIGVLVAVFLRMLGDFACRLTGLTQGWETLIATILLIAATAGLVYFPDVRISKQIGTLVQTLPEALGQLQSYLR